VEDTEVVEEEDTAVVDTATEDPTVTAEEEEDTVETEAG
jgi:hypothetical protein